MTRVYYWYKGADPKRNGGPWWYRDFIHYPEAIKHKTALNPLYHAYAITKGEEGKLPPMNIRPPEDAEIFYPNGRNWMTL
jgi:hypothetical protein